MVVALMYGGLEIIYVMWVGAKWVVELINLTYGIVKVI